MIENVQAGANLLDSHDPEWFEKVNIDTLHMGSCIDCVLGQLYEGYCEGLNKINVNAFESSPEDYQYGFDDPKRRYAELTNEWIKEIQKRQQS